MTKRSTRYRYPERLERSRLRFTDCSLFDAAVSAAASVDWIADHPGYITLATETGRFLTRVWNADAYLEEQAKSDDRENVRIVGHLAIPLTPEVSFFDTRRSIHLIMEQPA